MNLNHQCIQLQYNTLHCKCENSQLTETYKSQAEILRYLQTQNALIMYLMHYNYQ